jgi:3-phenylpropionate/trans-cinnamate dioxygenase ferredoxin reductase subunit
MNRLHVKYLLVGGGVASSSAAQAIRRRDSDGSVLMIAQEVNRTYRRPALSKGYLLGQISRDQLFTTPDAWFSDNRIELRTGRRVSRLDADRSCATLDTGEEVAYDRLLIATGGLPRALRIPGAQLPNVFLLRGIEDADRLRHGIEKALREGRPHPRGRGCACVIGAGRLGLELAATLTQAGLHVHLVCASPWPWGRLAGEATGRFLAHYLENRGVSLHAQLAARAIEGDGRVQRIVLSDGQVIDCDLVVPALGMIPHKELIRHTSIAAENAILADDHCRTSHPAIYAAGDCAAIFDPLFGKYRVMDSWDTALASGAVAGANMAGADQRYSDVNHLHSRVFDLALHVWGEARLAERRLIRGRMSVESPDFVEIAVAADGRICQVIAVGHDGEHSPLRELVARRVDVSGREQAFADPQADLGALMR